MTEPITVLTSVGNADEARAIARALVQARLAACVQVLPVQSVYRWQGSINEDPEQQLQIKTTRDRWADVVELIRSLHSYELPVIEALPVCEATPEFLAWLSEQTDGQID